MDKEIKLRIKPRFNFFYELFMPLGIKFRTDILAIIIGIIIILTINLAGKDLMANTVIFGINLINILNIVCVVLLVLFALKLVFDIVLKILQYKNMTYTFYDDNLVYEDSFLNQQKKIIKYENIKEVEIRRTVFDRIMGYGIIIISTNAEGNFRSGLIIYGVEHPNQIYEQVNDLVHKFDEEIKNNRKIEVKSEPVQEQTKNYNNQNVEDNYQQDEEDFKNSLKNIK